MKVERTEELLKKLHSAMLNDNEHQCNRLNNYIHTDEYLTAEVVQVVREIVTEATKELQEENGKLLQKIEELEKDVTENESDCSMCDFPKLKQDLEKENATLKKQLEALSGDIPWNELKDISEVTKELTEAKELIKEWLRLHNSNTKKTIIKKSVNFLKG